MVTTLASVPASKDFISVASEDFLRSSRWQRLSSSTIDRSLELAGGRSAIGDSKPVTADRSRASTETGTVVSK